MTKANCPNSEQQFPQGARTLKGLDLSGEALPSINRELKTQPLSKALREHFLKEYSDLASTLEVLEKDPDTKALLKAVRPATHEPTGRGEEAICFSLPPTPHLLKNKHFQTAIQSRLYNRADALERLYDDLLENNEGLLASEIADSPIDLVMNHLPDQMVVKLVRPDCGAWEPDWGGRPFDTPIYFFEEIGDGYFLVIQERLIPIDSIGPLEQTLSSDFQVIDPIGTLQTHHNSLGSGQSGYNRFGRIELFDYSAVGRCSDDPAKAMISNHMNSDSIQGFFELQEARQEEDEKISHGITDKSGDHFFRQRVALSGRSEFWLEPENVELLKILLEESIDDQVPDEEQLESIATLRALELAREIPIALAFAIANDEIDRVVEQALKDGLLEK